MAMNSTSNNSTSNIRLTLGILGTKVVFQSKKYFFFFFLAYHNNDIYKLSK